MAYQKRDRMGSVSHEGRTLTCSRGKKWPPIEVIVYGSVREARPEVSSSVYTALRVWEQACGLRGVSLDKCPSCPYVLIGGKPPPTGKQKIHPTTATRMANARKAYHDKHKKK